MAQTGRHAGYHHIDIFLGWAGRKPIRPHWINAHMAANNHLCNRRDHMDFAIETAAHLDGNRPLYSA